MIKFYKNQKHYAEEKWIHRETAWKRIKRWDVICIPKGYKYCEVTDQVSKDYKN